MTDEHEWALGKCLHEELDTEWPGEKEILDPEEDVETLKELFSIIMNPRLIYKAPYYVNCR